jgi:hypothetical protein
MKGLLRKWWFWVGLVVAIVAVWWLWGYFAWMIHTAPIRAQQDRAQKGWLAMQAEEKALEAQYRADTYGGATPEETLRLFVEALEKKDFELASKYVVPENRAQFTMDLSKGVKSGGLDAFVNAYRNGKIVPPKGVGSSGIYEFELYEPGSDVPFGARLGKNPFSGKWKIIEL